MSAPSPSPSGDSSATNMSSNFLSMFGCANCWPRTRLTTRAIMIIGAVGTLLGMIGLTGLTACFPMLFFQSFPLSLFHIYRLFLSPLIGMGFISGLFVMFMLWQMAEGIEQSRGTVWFAFTFLSLSVMTNMILTVIVLLLGVLAGSDFFLTLGSAGLWPSTMALMSLESMKEPDAQRPICSCFPQTLASKYQPLVMLLLMTLMMQSLDGGMIIGTGLGYLVHFLPRLQLSLATTQRWEEKEWMRSVKEMEGFVPASGGGVSVVGGGAWSGGAQDGGAAPAAVAAPSVFASPGHRLGDSSSSTAASTSSSILPFTLPFASSSSSSSSNPASSAEARNQRAAAAAARLGKSTSSSTTSTLTSPHPLPAVSSKSSSPVPKLARPPSPSIKSSPMMRPASSSSSATVSSSSAAVMPSFTLGIDDSDDDIYTDSSSTVNTKPTAEQEPDDLESQGFSQGSSSGSKRKSGYAQVVSNGNDEDELDLEAGAADDQEEQPNANERTAFQIQR